MVAPSNETEIERLRALIMDVARIQRQEHETIEQLCIQFNSLAARCEKLESETWDGFSSKEDWLLNQRAERELEDGP